jgi:hypothetical protein
MIILLWVLIQLPPVQTWLVARIGNVLEKETGYQFNIEKVDVRFPTELVLKDVSILDLNNDTILNSKELSLRGLNGGFSAGHLGARKIQLIQPHFHLNILKGDSTSNLTPLLDYFGSSQSDSSTSTQVQLDEISIRNGHFSFHDYNKEAINNLIDFNHIDLSEINVDVNDFYAAGPELDAVVNSIRFKEQKGFTLTKLSGAFSLRQDSLQLQQFNLNTVQSKLAGNLLFKGNQWNAFNNFNEEVYMKANFESSKLDFADLAYFSSDLIGLERVVEFEGKVRGTVSNIKARNLFVKLDENTWLRGNINMTGLPNFRETFIDASITELNAIKSELDIIPLPPFNGNKTIKTPPNFKQLGDIGFTGKFTGFLNDFVAFGTIKTNLGSIESDIELIERKNTFEYRGDLKTIQFDLGKFYSEKNFGKVTSTFVIDGKGLTRDDLDASINGTIESLSVKGYEYKRIQTSGDFKQNFFQGKLGIIDPNVQLTFDGIIDFTESVPFLDFITQITHFNPSALNLVEISDYTSISGDFRIKSRGLKLENINGSLEGEDILICTATSEYPLEHLELNLAQNAEGKSFQLTSDLASGQLKGKFNLSGLQAGIEDILADAIPHISKKDTKQAHLPEDFELALQVHNFELFSQLFIPELELAAGSRLLLNMNDQKREFEGTFTTDRIAYKEFVMDTLTIDISRPDESLYLTILTDRFYIGEKSQFNSVSLDMRNENDTIYSNFAWGESEDLLRGDLMVQSEIISNNTIYTKLNGASIWFDQNEWTLQDTAQINVIENRIDIDLLNLAYENQFIRLLGTLSDNPYDQMSVQLKDVDIAFLDPVLANAGITQRGLVNGNLNIRDAYGKAIISSDLAIDAYFLNEYLIGDINVDSDWDQVKRRLKINGNIKREQLETIGFEGFYNPDNEESPLGLTAELNSLPLVFLNGLISEGISNIDGAITGKIEITGPLGAPKLQGGAEFENASLKVDYLNTTYYLNEKVGIYSDMFTLDYIRINDEEDNSAFAVGTIIHDNFADWNFDVYLDMEEQPFMCLNTDENQNTLYYGKAFATGYVNIFGADSDLMIDVNVKTQKGTVISMPLGGSEEIAFEDFITFIDKDEAETEALPVDLSGINMNLELDITPDARFNIIFDDLVGDEMHGRGKGHINMVINNLSSFKMYGDIFVQEGGYLFTLKNLINKEFEVEPGGKISWFGDPLAADIDLKAIYRLNTSLYDLMPEESDEYKQRVPVNLVMNLDGKLLNPSIDFDILLPSSDELTKSRVTSAINTEQETNKQAFALLVLRRFLSPPDIAKTNSSIGLAENSTELISAQLSNWLSQISDDFDIGVNYSPGDEISNEELAVALSTQLFNERLLISGSFGVTHAQNADTGDNPNSLIGDIRIEYKITDDGKIRLIVYNESNEYDLANTQQARYTQGFGIVYQQEFDTLYELFHLPD